MLQQAVAFLASAKPEDALQFYTDVLGLTLREDTPFAIVLDAFGTTLRIQKVERVAEAPYTVFGFEVEDIAAEVQRLHSLDVAFVRYPHFPQDALGVWASPSGAKVAWFHDPDGNLLSLTEMAR